MSTLDECFCLCHRPLGLATPLSTKDLLSHRSNRKPFDGPLATSPYRVRLMEHGLTYRTGNTRVNTDQRGGISKPTSATRTGTRRDVSFHIAPHSTNSLKLSPPLPISLSLSLSPPLLPHRCFGGALSTVPLPTMAERIKSFDLGAKTRPSFSKLRRGAVRFSRVEQGKGIRLRPASLTCALYAVCRLFFADVQYFKALMGVDFHGVIEQIYLQDIPRLCHTV